VLTLSWIVNFERELIDMSLLDLLAAGYLAKRAHNKLNPPMVEVPSGTVLIGVKAVGTNEYRIRHRKEGNNSWAEFTVSRNTRSRSGGWKFHWD